MKPVITSAELIGKLPLVAENIFAEAAQQPILFVQAAEYRIGKMRNRARASATLEQHQASVALRIRGKKDPEGKKATEASIKEQVELNATTKQLRERHESAHAQEQFSMLLLEAFRMRRDAIRVLADHALYNRPRESSELDQIEESVQLRNQARHLGRERRKVGVK